MICLHTNLVNGPFKDSIIGFSLRILLSCKSMVQFPMLRMSFSEQEKIPRAQKISYLPL